MKPSLNGDILSQTSYPPFKFQSLKTKVLDRKMSCCTPNPHSDTKPNKLTCPINGKTYRTIPNQTLLHHLKTPWTLESLETPFAFCDDPKCKVIYFNAAGQTFTQKQIRTPVGQKSNSDNALICYCFGVDKTTTQNQPEAKAFVIQQTKNHQCACEIRNPSSRCCLKDF